jgi:hypothetical protein
MTESIYQRYGFYLREKEKKKNPAREGGFFKKTYERVKWKKIYAGSFSFHRPCLEN